MTGDRSSDPFPIELLAAYVDGELEAGMRQRVEAWLAEHPEALAELADQEGLCPGNEEYWESVAPPQPSNEAWDRRLARIESSLTPRMPARRAGGRRNPRFAATALALASVAAALMIAVVALDRQPPAPPLPLESKQVAQVAVAPHEDEDFVFPVATADDVELMQLPEEASNLLVVGRHPLNGVALAFADSTDVQVLNYGLDDQGEVADYQIMRGPDTPMFVAPPRRK